MIIITKRKMDHWGSCNYCSRGKVMDDSPGLSYPYEFIYELSSDESVSTTTRICPKCMNNLVDQLGDIKVI